MAMRAARYAATADTRHGATRAMLRCADAVYAEPGYTWRALRHDAAPLFITLSIHYAAALLPRVSLRFVIDATLMLFDTLIHI